jgi:NAD(P)H-dependent flavin oxidoreductase YrpB (nitropropane dioxygenase family)
VDDTWTRLTGSTLPIIAAPMAGGATSPRLVRTVAGSGGFAFLAAGYQTPDVMRSEMDELDGVPFGMNVFAPNPTPVAVPEFRRYAREIADEGADYGLALADQPIVEDDDHWQAKIDLLLENPVPVVSFTFGLPSRAAVLALKRAGSAIAVTVTSSAEAQAAEEIGADVLLVQGGEAGGHSGMHTPDLSRGVVLLDPLLGRIREVSSLPLVAAGGVSWGWRVRNLLSSGAAAVMVGTALLRTDESAATQTHKDALADPAFTRTVLTHAFTGRPARALQNGFINRHQATAPLGYPAVHHLTRAMRSAAAAAGDTDRVHLWAGTGFRNAHTGPAADVIAGLASQL